MTDGGGEDLTDQVGPLDNGYFMRLLLKSHRFGKFVNNFVTFTHGIHVTRFFSIQYCRINEKNILSPVQSLNDHISGGPT